MVIGMDNLSEYMITRNSYEQLYKMSFAISQHQELSFYAYSVSNSESVRMVSDSKVHK